MARGGAISIEASGDGELAARVTLKGSPLTPRVTLYPADVEWECDCGSPLEVCEHVAASVIAARRGTAKTREARPVEYRLRRTPGGLFFERGVSDEAGFHAIEVPLDALAAGRFHGPSVDATPGDLAIEKALRGTFAGVLDRDALPRVFGALARHGVGRITLDGEPVLVSGEPLLPAVLVEDAPGGFRIRLAAPAETGVLRPEGEPELSGRERHDLDRRRVFRPDEVGELVGSVLPSLSKRLPVDIRTKRLPAAIRERPRLSLLCKRHGNRLHVLPKIVYGDPNRADVVPLRDRDAERALEKRFLQELGLYVGRREVLNAEDAIDFIRKLERFDGIVEGDGRAAFALHPELEPRFTVEENDLAIDFGGAEASAVLRAWREGASLVPLTGGGYSPLPLDWLERYAEPLADLLAARTARGELPRSALPDLARLCDTLDRPRPPGFETLRALVDDVEAFPDVPMPGGLRDYQRDGVRWLAFLKRAGLGALLADDMGLGKTVQALSVMEGRSLVVAPTSVLRNWMDEARKFRPELTVALYHGVGRKLDPAANVTVTSHALLRVDRDVLSEVDWDVVAIDEAQAIRNPDTELARAAFALTARFRMSLTGTPIENRLVDLWSQLHFVNPGFLGGLSDFEDRYVRPVARGETEPLERLRERLRPFFLRRLKSEVAPELPPRTEMTLRAELSEPEREVYEAVRLAVRKDVIGKLGNQGGVLAALEALLRLRQAACHPALVPGQTGDTSSKTELLLSALDTAALEGHKALVFSQWTSMLDLLEPHVRARGLGFVRLDGSTRDRAGVVERFQEDDGVSVFLISLKAGGTGLNLTAADHVFLFDPWWNPAVEQQAFDRAHRIGQDKPVFVHRLVAADTVEERILELQNEKRSLADMAAGSAAPSWSRDDLLRLLEE